MAGVPANPAAAATAAVPGTVNIAGHRVSMKVLGGLVLGVVGLLVLRARQRARAANAAGAAGGVPTGQGDGTTVPGYDSNQSAIAGIGEALNQLQATVQQNQAAASMSASPAAVSPFAGGVDPSPSADVTDQGIATSYYQQYLGRAPDAAGLAYNAALIGSRGPGFDRDQFINSAEARNYRAGLVESDYQTYFGRNAESQAVVDYWSNAIAGQSAAAIASQFAQSPEGVARAKQLANQPQPHSPAIGAAS